MPKHLQNLTPKWAPFLPEIRLVEDLASIVGSLGGSRPTWTQTSAEQTTMLMAWPQTSLLRVGAIVQGPEQGPLEPMAVLPFMEGFANLLTIEDSYAWKDGYMGEVLASYDPKSSPICFFDPLFFRDKVVDLSPGINQVVMLSGLCYGVRRALMDEIIVTRGPNYEAHAAKWLEENPGKTRLDVPVLKIPISGMNVMMPGEAYCDYQARCRIYDVESFKFGPPGLEQKVYRFGVNLGSQEKSLFLIMYAAERILAKDYIPKDEDEVDLMFWMQGRIADIGEEVAAAEAEAEA